MIIFGYKIERDTSSQTNPMSLVCLGATLIFLCIAAIDSGYFASYRFGDSIIPREDQLVRSGPYLIEIHAGRITPSISFTPVSEGNRHSEKLYNFDDENTILQLVHHFKGKPVAYLWLYSDNPVRQVWKIDVNRQLVLSYDKARKTYLRESDPTSNLLTAISFFVFFYY